jgi:AcrR family transcriptional regulator
MNESKKDEIFWKVLNAAIDLDFSRGHLRWSMSELSRKCKITRSLIYYYFGKSKESILQEGVKLLGEEFFGLTPARLALWKSGDIGESVLQTKRLLEKSPHMAAFYFVHREADTGVGDQIRSLEKEYRKKIKNFLTGASDVYQEVLFGLFMGLVITPKLSDEAVKKAIQLLGQILQKPLK